MAQITASEMACDDYEESDTDERLALICGLLEVGHKYTFTEVSTGIAFLVVVVVGDIFL